MFDFALKLIAQTGYWGILLLMFGENLFPPVPSELIMPLAGYQAAMSGGALWLVILFGTIGSVLGGLLWYGLGRWVGREGLYQFARKHGRWLTLSTRDLDKASKVFDRNKRFAVLVGRLIPGVRTFISVPAGIARMRIAPYLVYSTLGTVIWTSFLAGAGYLLRHNYELVSRFLNPVSNVVVGALIALYIYRVITFDKNGNAKKSAAQPT